MKDLDRLRQFAERNGWSVTQGRSHLKWRGPEGQLVVSSVTPSDGRALKNLRATLRREGLDLPTAHHPKKRKKK